MKTTLFGSIIKRRTQGKEMSLETDRKIERCMANGAMTQERNCTENQCWGRKTWTAIDKFVGGTVGNSESNGPCHR